MLLGVFILGMYMGWWKKLFGLESLSVCKSSNAPSSSAAPLAAKKSADALVRTVQTRRPRIDQVQAEEKLMQARKASALNMSALSQERRRRRF